MDNLGRDRLADECSFMLFPVIINGGFDSSDALSPKGLRKILHTYQSGVNVYLREDFEKRYLARHDRDTLDMFYSHLFNREILSLAGSDSLWSAMPGRYLVVIRLHDGMSIKSFEGVRKRKIVLESELWHTKRHEVVWRLRTSGFEMGDTVSDAEFIARGVEEIFSRIPEFLSSRNEENW